MNSQILLVDDDALLRRSLKFSLEQVGYRVTTVASAEDALKLLAQNRPDLILLDINLSGMDGLEALRLFQDITSAPILFLTARRRELDEILGLELGADDYITKPFDKDVLLARIRTALRRAQHVGPTTVETVPLQVGDLLIDPIGHTVTVQGKSIVLSVREFGLLYTLAQNVGRVMAIDDLIVQVWGEEYAGEPQAVYVYIRTLRQKLQEAAPHCACQVVTVRGVGYKLITQENAAKSASSPDDANRPEISAESAA